MPSVIIKISQGARGKTSHFFYFMSLFVFLLRGFIIVKRWCVWTDLVNVGNHHHHIRKD